jgi:hypothetical protein
MTVLVIILAKMAYDDTIQSVLSTNFAEKATNFA